jgi:hypothetical protein
MKETKDQRELLEELIHVFIEIDGRIKMLHNDSSTVFLQLNRYLKDYHKKYGLISKNVTQIFDTTIGSEGKNLSNDFDQIYKELREYKSLTEKESLSNLNQLSKLNSKANFISVIIRNFNQELTTFIFLTTNYRLISNNENFDDASHELISQWEKTAIQIQENLLKLSKAFEQLKTKTNTLHNQSQSFYDDSVNQVFSFYEDLGASSILINKKERESNSHLALLKKKMENSKNSIGNIITHLQYHDIIRQKIEHIQTSHMNIVESLKKDIETNSDSDNAEEKNAKFPLISDISGLQAAQLILISKEYQKALEVITQNFQIIASDLTSVSNISNDFSYEGKNSETTITQGIKNKLDKSILLLDSFNLSQFNSDLADLLKQFDTIYTIWEDEIYEPLKSFETLASNIEKKADTENHVPSRSPSIIYQLASLAEDILSKRNEMHSEIEQTMKYSSKLIIYNDHGELGSYLEKEQIRLMVKISKILERLDAENLQLDELLQQNNSLSKDIINRLEETINYVDYYDLFDNVLKEIIKSLNMINDQLIDGDHRPTEYDKIKNLKEIEALYTVASERIIHNNVIEGKGQMNIPEEDNDDEEEDEVELF